MSLKTKDRPRMPQPEAGILLIIKEIRAESGNVVEKKGRRWYVVGGRWGRRTGPGFRSANVGCHSSDS